MHPLRESIRSPRHPEKVSTIRCSSTATENADSVRRHTEDGCPKRFELGIREGSGTTPARWSLTNYPERDRPYSVGIPQASPMAPLSTTPSTAFPNFGRPEFGGSGASGPPVYAS